MRKTIKIFMASSIVEFEHERLVIENFIYRLSNDLEDKYDVKIKPILCENLDDAYSTVRKQEEYNDKIRQSELCFFIFFTKAGQYTQEEFEVARKAFEESGKPKIYTYFKIIKDGEGEQSLYDFMKKLDEVFGHYYGTFDHVDTIKLRILLSLKLREMDFLEIKSEDGKCVVDGKSVMSLDNVAEFQNNSNLANLQKELKEVEQKYYEMKPIYAKGGCDDTFYREYCKVASRRQDLIDEIEQLQKAIFNMSMRMSADETYGEVTPRQKEAYRLFELGDYEGCMAVLDAEEIKNDYLRQIKMLEEQKATVCRKFIGENKTAIDILMTMTNYQGRFDEIVRRYEDIVPIALAEGIELNVVYDYVVYLWEQNNHKKAIELSEKLNSLPTWNNDKENGELAYLYSMLSILYGDVSQPQKAEEYHLKAIEIEETLAKENSQRHTPNLATCYNNAGNFYEHQGNYKKAEEYHLKAIEIYEALAKENPERFNPDLAMSYNNTGIFYKNIIDYKEAEIFFLKAIEIREELAQENPERFVPGLAITYNNAGNYYEHQGDYKKAEKYLLKAIEIRERLAKENPERHTPDLASSYNNAGIVYIDQGDYKKAEEYFLMTIEIYKVLTKENPERFNSYLATSYNNIGAFYSDQGDYEKVEIYLLKAIDIREALAKKNPQRFNPYLATTYYNYGLLVKDNNYFDKALAVAKTCPNNYRCKQIIERLSKH